MVNSPRPCNLQPSPPLPVIHYHSHTQDCCCLLACPVFHQFNSRTHSPKYLNARSYYQQPFIQMLTLKNFPWKLSLGLRRYITSRFALQKHENTRLTGKFKWLTGKFTWLTEKFTWIRDLTTFQLRRFALNASESGFSLTFALLLSRFYTLFTRY